MGLPLETNVIGADLTLERVPFQPRFGYQIELQNLSVSIESIQRLQEDLLAIDPTISFGISLTRQVITLETSRPQTISQVEEMIRSKCGQLGIPLEEAEVRESAGALSYEKQVELYAEEDMAAMERRFKGLVERGVFSAQKIAEMRLQKGTSQEIWEELGAGGVLAWAIPVEHGGRGGGLAGTLHLFRLLNRIDSGLALAVLASELLGLNRFYELCEDKEFFKEICEQVRDGKIHLLLAMTELNSGSHPSLWDTHGFKNGENIIVIGSKDWITDACVAKTGVVYVRMESGKIAAVMLDPEREVSLEELPQNPGGWARGQKEEKLGANLAQMGSLHFNHYIVVPKYILTRDVGERMREGLEVERVGLMAQVMGAFDAIRIIVQERNRKRSLCQPDQGEPSANATSRRFSVEHLIGKIQASWSLFDEKVRALIQDCQVDALIDSDRLRTSDANLILNEIIDAAVEACRDAFKIGGAAAYAYPNELREIWAALPLFYPGGGADPLRRVLGSKMAIREYEQGEDAIPYLEGAERYPAGSLRVSFKKSLLNPTYLNENFKTIAEIISDWVGSRYIQSIQRGKNEDEGFIIIKLNESLFAADQGVLPEGQLSRKQAIGAIDVGLSKIGLYRQVNNALGAYEPARM